MEPALWNTNPAVYVGGGGQGIICLYFILLTKEMVLHDGGQT